MNTVSNLSLAVSPNFLPNTIKGTNVSDDIHSISRCIWAKKKLAGVKRTPSELAGIDPLLLWPMVRSAEVPVPGTRYQGY